MRILKKRNILKLAATFMLVGMMVGTFAMHTKAAFAERATGCTTGTPTTTTGNCTMGVTFTSSSTDTSLSFISDGIVTVTGNTFTFTVTVTDERTTPNQGWSLSAAVDTSAMLTTITGISGLTCVAPSTGSPTGGTPGCPDPASVSTPLSITTPAAFATAATSSAGDTAGYVKFTVSGTLTAFGVAGTTNTGGNIILSIA